MKALQGILVFALSMMPITASAQKWEIGGVGGGSFYTSQDVTRGSNSVKASFSPGFAAGFLLSQEMGRYWGGDIRYTYLHNDAKLDGTGGKATFGAEAHAIHYDFLLHFTPSGSKNRPYISFGAGIEHHRGTGIESVTQPLSEYALLTKTTDTTPMVSLGAGVKLRIAQKSNIRLEIKSYLSPISNKIFAPNRGASVSGWLFNFVPMVGITYEF